MGVANGTDSGVEAELKKLQENQARNIGRRLYEAMDTSDDILSCYRRIHGHLERLAVRYNAPY